ncbi:MAG TPA: HAD hydrolase family protein [Chitinophagaceae bacterium]|jgi:hydroxymethylpyrimidine pyrophosphatase-like HAD family hydrolase
MALPASQSAQLQHFFNHSKFEECGGLITDLDGTAIHEFEGRYTIPQSVQLGLDKIYDLGRPIVLNTLRFPLSVIRTFGQEWYKISNAAIPTVLMNGSQLGYIMQSNEGNFLYNEIDAFPLEPNEIAAVLQIITSFIKNNDLDLLVFYYPRDWEQGEIIWTPLADKIEMVQKKYMSASNVYSSSLENLQSDLHDQEICMIFLLIDVPQDRLMAYQHTKRNNFFTHKGVDKDFGAQQIANHLQFELKHSIGAGDTEMDSFLRSVGLAIHVGNPLLSYESLLPPIKVKNSSEFGEILFELAAMQRNVIG